MNLHSVMLIALTVAALFEAAAYLRRRAPRDAILAGCLMAAVAAATFILRPEAAPDRAVFGAADQGFSVMTAVAAMFLSIALGIAARYLFETEKEFDWVALLRPLVISPLLLLPLIGTLDNGELQPLQLVSLSVLSFQNGFFWQKVLASLKIAEPRTRPVTVDSGPTNT